MSRLIRNLRVASEELADAISWYEEQRQGLGAEFFDCVVQATSLIQSPPEISTLDSNRRTLRILVQRFPYQVVYSLTSDEIIILAIAHLKRQPGYWKSRGSFILQGRSPGRKAGMWKVLDRKTVLSAPPWVKVFQETVELPRGTVVPDFYQIELPDFVTIAAFTPERKLLLVRGYRHGPRGIVLGAPSGIIEPGEAPLAAAKRELIEETGFSSDEWEPLGEFVIDDNKGCGRMHVFRAHNVRKTHEPVADESETLELSLMDPAEVRSRMFNGEIRSVAHAATLALALLRE